ncbi:MAG: hypothetical protein M3P84_11130 [Chloroflexota bacterium]|nr:hypothetical protein [Chloroflexota bacterium]
MTTRSWPGVAIGALIALILPITYWLLARLVENGAVQIPETGMPRNLIQSLDLNVIAQLTLTIVGIWIVGRSAGLQSTLAWLSLFLVGLPVLAFVWFVTYATLGGTLGSPF